jgi:hypothetical protein
MTNVQEKIQIILDNLYENLQDVVVRIPSNTDQVIEYLFDNILNNQYFKSNYSIENSAGHKKLFKLLSLNSPNDFFILQVNKRSLSLKFFNTVNDDDIGNNNIGFSWQPSRNMYIGGIKTDQTNVESDKIIYTFSGTFGLEMMKNIMISLKMKSFFIDDAAHVFCPWDNKIDIENFSIARIIAGKDGFYERLPGHFTYPEKAEQAKIFLRSPKNTSQQDIDLCKRFVERKEGTSSECNKINRIIKESIKKLRENDFISDKGQIVLFEYIVINPTMGNTGGKKKSRKSKKSRINKKSRKNKRSKRKKRSRKNKK